MIDREHFRRHLAIAHKGSYRLSPLYNSEQEARQAAASLGGRYVKLSRSCLSKVHDCRCEACTGEAYKVRRYTAGRASERWDIVVFEDDTVAYGTKWASGVVARPSFEEFLPLLASEGYVVTKEPRTNRDERLERLRDLKLSDFRARVPLQFQQVRAAYPHRATCAAALVYLCERDGLVSL